MHSVTPAISAYKFILMLLEIIYFEVKVCSSASGHLESSLRCDGQIT
jgi:hypothetical protein